MLTAQPRLAFFNSLLVASYRTSSSHGDSHPKVGRTPKESPGKQQIPFAAHFRVSAASGQFFRSARERQRPFLPQLLAPVVLIVSLTDLTGPAQGGGLRTGYGGN